MITTLHTGIALVIGWWSNLRVASLAGIWEGAVTGSWRERSLHINIAYKYHGGTCRIVYHAWDVWVPPRKQKPPIDLIAACTHCACHRDLRWEIYAVIEWKVDPMINQ